MLPLIPPAVYDPSRLAALERYSNLGTSTKLGFEDIVQLASRLCAVPVAPISLVASDRQWSRARVGFALCGTDLTVRLRPLAGTGREARVAWRQVPLGAEQGERAGAGKKLGVAARRNEAARAVLPGDRGRAEWRDFSRSG